MTKEITKEKTTVKNQESTSEDHFLILINDDEHSFDYVIETLIDVCDHSFEQASQCTMITHYKGKCDVKKGSLDFLRPLRHILVERELKAIIS
ncbi:MAG: ATP-dependent Clp protease adaptor ClpS [Prolixibacteraceae bacterium]|nr:ATP-dependent Clp protease adaptor ClpS [Prolixibacteraceae bacterium]